jgi:nucleoside-diphosphate-sugar epimerase
LPVFDLNGARILVTGANGFVGRNLISYLCARGHEVIACTRNENDAERFALLDCKHRVLDYGSVERLRTQLADVDVIFHAAADLRNWGRQSLDDNFNVRGTRSLLDAASGQVRRFVLVSTEAVLLGTQSMKNLTERTPYPSRPVGQYAISKQTAEKMVLSIDAAVMECVSVRPRMVWGRDDTTILPKLIKAVSSGRFLWIEHGNYLTSSTHIDNLCEGLYLAAQRGRAGQSYFITDGSPITFREFVLLQLKDYSGNVTNRSLPRSIVLVLAWLIEPIWHVFGFEQPPPIMRSQVYLTGRPVTVNDSLARSELGYRGKSFAERARESGVFR